MKVNKNEQRKKVGFYMRVGNMNQLDYDVITNIENKNEPNVVGLYIHSECKDSKGLQYNIYSQKKQLEEYCEKNGIENKVIYIDIGKSALSKDRPALNKMKEDIKNGKINNVLITTASKLFRNMEDMMKFINYCKKRDVAIFSLDAGFVKDTFDNFLSNKCTNESSKELDDIDDEINY